MRKLRLFMCMACAMLLLTMSAFAKDPKQVKYDFVFHTCPEAGKFSKVAIGIKSEKFVKESEFVRGSLGQSGFWKMVAKVPGVHAVESITPAEIIFLTDLSANRIEVMNAVVAAIGKKKKWAMYAAHQEVINYCQNTSAATTQGNQNKPRNKPTEKPVEDGDIVQFHKDLKPGMVDPDVGEWQQFLLLNSMFDDPEVLKTPGTTKNRFGPATQAATIKFQTTFKSLGLKPTGILDETTRAVVNDQIKKASRK